jgi:hypothetical protein
VLTVAKLTKYKERVTLNKDTCTNVLAWVHKCQRNKTKIFTEQCYRERDAEILKK